MKRALPLLMILLSAGAGCRTTPAMPEAPPQVTLIGRLSPDTSQRPVMIDPLTGKREECFFIYVMAKGGNWRQWIVVNRTGAMPPSDVGRDIEFKGRLTPMRLGGTKGRKSQTAGNVLYLEFWTYPENPASR